METSDSIKNIAAALCTVQAHLKPLKRNADNPFFKSNYTDLSAMTEALYPLLSAEGLSVIQGGDGSTLDTMLLHTSGEWVKTSLTMPAESNPQKLGSVVTYFRRYALAAIVGAVSEGEDDDGNAASHPPARSASAPPPANRPSPASEARPTPPAPAPTTPEAGPALTVTFVDTATGEKAGKPWTRYSAKFSDGTKASTFDTKHGALLQEAKAKNLPVIVGFAKQGNFTNITSVILGGGHGSDVDDENAVPW